MEEFSVQCAIKEAGYEPRSYSGRGMYGKECLAFSIEGTNVFGAIADLVNECHDGCGDRMYEALNSITEAIRNIKTDSLGKGTIIYFPGFEFVDEDDKDSCPHGMFYAGYNSCPECTDNY